MPPHPAAGFEYPEHIDRASLEALPRKPGVYFFRAPDGTPLYIGKSVDLRSRVLSHLRTPQEAGMLQATCRIDFVRTAGEIGALLLESQLIKQWQPAYNAQLKQLRDTFSLALEDGGTRPRVVDCSGRHGTGYGLYASRGAAEEGLRHMVRRHGLCPALLGLESAIRGRACFSHQIGRCRGACIGHESLESHHARLQAALAQLQEAVWPYPGPVGIVERDQDLRQVHVVDRWSYLGSLQGRCRKLRKSRGQAVDIDTYRILVKPVLAGELEMKTCKVEGEAIWWDW